MSSMETKQLSEVAPGDCVRINGSMGKIYIEGDVGENARVCVDGSMGVIQVGGYIHDGAEVVVNGSMGRIWHNGHAKTAIVEARGSMGSVIKQDLIGFQPKAPKRPKPPRPPRPPRMPSFPHLDSHMFSSSNEDIIITNVSDGHSVKIVGDEVWIDGKKIGEPEKASETPPEEHHTVSVQKSARPREMWGT